MHVFMNLLGWDFIEQAYVDEPGSTVVGAVPDYDIAEGRWLDVAGFDPEGKIVVAVEANRQKPIPAVGRSHV